MRALLYFKSGNFNLLKNLLTLFDTTEWRRTCLVCHLSHCTTWVFFNLSFVEKIDRKIGFFSSFNEMKCMTNRSPFLFLRWKKESIENFDLQFFAICVGICGQTGTLCHPLYILCNTNLVTLVNIRCTMLYKVSTSREV